MDMTRLPNAARYARIGPATIPYAIAIGLAVLSVATAIAAFFGMSNRMANFTSLRPNDEFYAMGRAMGQG